VISAAEKIQNKFPKKPSFGGKISWGHGN
jgi:hypothetical protein